MAESGGGGSGTNDVYMSDDEKEAKPRKSTRDRKRPSPYSPGKVRTCPPPCRVARHTLLAVSNSTRPDPPASSLDSACHDVSPGAKPFPRVC